MLSLEGFLEEEVGLWTRGGGKENGPNPVPEKILLSSLDSLEGRGERKPGNTCSSARKVDKMQLAGHGCLLKAHPGAVSSFSWC